MNKIPISLKLKCILILLITISFISCFRQPNRINSYYQILVDFHPFESVEDASNAEATVDWSGKDDLKMNACTESFAALELQNYLRKLNKDKNINKPFAINYLHDINVQKSIVITDLSNSLIRTVVEREKLKEKLNIAESFAIIPEGNILYIIGHDRVGLGYFNANGKIIGKAIQAGALISTHLFNGCVRMIDRNSNVIYSQLSKDELWASFIPDEYHIPYSTLKMGLRSK